METNAVYYIYIAYKKPKYVSRFANVIALVEAIILDRIFVKENFDSHKLKSIGY